MAQKSVVASATSRIVFIDATASDGTAKTDLVYNTANLAAAYIDDTDSGEVSITLADMSLGTWASGGLKHSGGGTYALGVPNAAFSGGGKILHIRLYDSSTGWQFGKTTVEITATNNQDATRGGMTALPNANAGSAGGLVTIGTSDNQFQSTSGQAIARAAYYYDLGAAAYQRFPNNLYQLTCDASGFLNANVVQMSGSSTAADNVEIVFDTDFATNYDATNNRWAVQARTWGDSNRSFIETQLPSSSVYVPLISSGGLYDVNEGNMIEFANTNGNGTVTFYIVTGSSFSLPAVTGAGAAIATQSSVDTIDGIADDILLDTAEIGPAGAGLSAIPKTGFKLASDGLDAPLGNSTAAAKLGKSADSMLTGTIDTTAHTPTTTQFECDDITEATTDHYKNRVVIFTSGALIRQVCSITSYSLVSGRGRFTVSTLTEAPANNDTLIIV